MKALFLLLPLSFLLSDAQAQWVPTSGPSGATVYSLATKGTDLFVGTQSGVYRSTDGGYSWASRSSGLPSYGDTRPIVVQGAYLFAGTSEGLHRSSDNGLSWSKLGVSGRPLAVGDTYVFAQIGRDSVIRSSDYGATWEPADSGHPHGNMDSFFATGDTVFMGLSDSLFRSTDAGSHWSRMTNGLPADRVQSFGKVGSYLYACLNYWGIHRSSDGGVNWIRANEGMWTYSVYTFVGDGTGAVYAGTSAGVFRSTDNGGHWATVNTGLWIRQVYALAALGDTLLAGTEYNGLFRSTDSGTNWTSSNTGLVLTYIQAFGVNGSELYAGTNKGLFKTTDNGQTWSELVVNTPILENITSLLARSPGTDSSTVFAGARRGRLYRSTDRGSTWTVADTTLVQGLISSLVESKSTVVASSGSTVYLSTNNGTTWTKVATGFPTTGFENLAADDSNLFAAGGWDGVFRSTDDGRTWTATNPGSPYWQVSSVALCGTDLFAGTFGMGAFHSTNQGAEWSQTLTGLATNWVNNFTVKGANVFAATADGVFMTSDSGLSWKHVSEGLPTNPIEVVAANDTFLFAGSGGRGVWRRPLSEILAVEPAAPELAYPPNGVFVFGLPTFRWHPFEGASRYHLQSSDDSLFRTNFLVNDSTVTDTSRWPYPTDSSFHGPIGDSLYWRVRAFTVKGWTLWSDRWLFRITGDAVKEEDGLPSTYSLEQNYPNPFNPSTMIRYALPRRSHVALAVFNTLGQEVAKLVNTEIEAGYHEVTFDARGLASGVYFYRIQAGDFVQSKKLLLLK